MVISIYRKQGFQYLKYMYVEDHKKVVSKEKWYLIWKINVFTIDEDAGPGIYKKGHIDELYMTLLKLCHKA